MRKEAGSRIPTIFKCMEGVGGDTVEEGVTVVKVGGDEGMDEGFGSRGGEPVSNQLIQRRWK